jgi:hypothetical protein
MKSRQPPEVSGTKTKSNFYYPADNKKQWCWQFSIKKSGQNCELNKSFIYSTDTKSYYVFIKGLPGAINYEKKTLDLGKLTGEKIDMTQFESIRKSLDSNKEVFFFKPVKVTQENHRNPSKPILLVPYPIKESENWVPYFVQQGDTIASIASERKIAWTKLWNENKKSGFQREDPFVLYPGYNYEYYSATINKPDELKVPEKEKDEKTVTSGKKKTFTLTGLKPVLRLNLSRDNEAIKDLHWELVIEKPESFTTGGDPKTIDNGFIYAYIDLRVIAAKKAKLRLFKLDKKNKRINQEEYDLLLNYIDPIEEKSGVQARLSNLNFYKGKIDDVDEDGLKDAVTAFQKKNSLTENGNWEDSAFKNKLKEVYGC